MSMGTFSDRARVTAADAPAPAPTASEKSVTGLSRDNWQPITLAADDGRIPHHPRYFGNSWGDSTWGTWRATADRPSPLLTTGDIDAEAAMATGHSRWTFTGDDLNDQVLNMTKFSLDLVTLPGAVVVTPPCQIHTSPAE